MKANAITLLGQRRPDEQARKRAMVRFNGMMFYSLTVASFLETAVPLDGPRLLRLLGADADTRQWLEGTWLPLRAAHGRALREYVETTWEEFDWSAAWQEFSAAYAACCASPVARHGAGLELVARCVTESAAAVFYRTLARCAEDPELAALAAGCARDHGACFDRFRELHHRFGRASRAGFARTCRTVFTCCSSSREMEVSAAFHPIARAWHGGWVFPQFTYADFLSRLAQLVRRHGALGPLERLLFRPWLNPPRRTGEPPRPVKLPVLRKRAPEAMAGSAA